MKNWGFSQWVISLCIICFAFSLQLRRVTSNSPPSTRDQVYYDFTSGRTLKEQVDDGQEIHCSRERSRAAWKIIEEYLMPFVEKEKYHLSTKCRLHSDNDLFRDQENHKIHVDINDWQCGYCKKRFYEEKHLDKHFNNRHYNLLNVSHSWCLADLCGALHCDSVLNPMSQKQKCIPAAAAKNKHLCESLADSCFPINGGPAASRLHEFFLRQFCYAHGCSKGQKPFSRGSKKKINVFYLCFSILTIMLLVLFYVYIYMYQRGMKTRAQSLKRISLSRRKKKPS